MRGEEAGGEWVFRDHAYNEWRDGSENTSRNEIDRLKRLIPIILDEFCTEKQRLYISYYFFDKKDIPEIARICNVNKSSVSRTIHTGLKNIYRHLRCASPLFSNYSMRSEKLSRKALFGSVILQRKEETNG